MAPKTQKRSEQQPTAAAGQQEAKQAVGKDVLRLQLTAEPQSPRSKAASLAGDALAIALAAAVSGFVMKIVMSNLDPNKDAKAAGRARARRLSKRLGRTIELQDLEQVICQDVVFPENVDVALSDIGGLDHLSNLLTAKILLPLQRPDLFRGSLLRLDKGVLLYGPPGTGKTMLAKALAKESGAAFINVSAASLQSKWYGETSRLVTALFRLARKIAPTIIFIDEVDSLLGRRREGDHEATTTMKTEFMAAWDGMLSSGDPVLVLGATNRPQELDAAVMRRYSIRLEVPMPGAWEREAILGIMLRQHAEEQGAASVEPQLLANQPLAPGRPRPLQAIAEATTGLSGSDLHQLCSHAAARPVLELATTPGLGPHSRPRPLAPADFAEALGAVQARAADAQRSEAATYLLEHVPIGALPNGRPA